MADNNSILEKLDGLVARFEEVSTLITDPAVIADQKRYVKLTKEYKELDDLMKARKEYMQLLANIEEAKDILSNESDADMREMAKEEMDNSQERLPVLEEADQYGMRVDGANGQLTASGTTVSVVSKNSSLIASDNGTLHVNADTVSLTSDMEAVWAEGGTVNISGKNIRIAGDTDSATVYAGSSGQAKINTSSGGTFTMTGNLYAEDNGAITLSLCFSVSL